MKTPRLATAAYPKHEFASIAHLGIKASNLALLHQVALEHRLPPGLLATLIDDLDALGVAIPGAHQVRAEARAATAAQTAALGAGHAHVKAVRSAVRKAGAPKVVQKAYGVGQSIDPRLVRDVKAALNQILDRAAEHPEEAAEFGIMEKDLEAISLAHQAVAAADKTQNHKQATAPLSTQERNRTANRILKTVARIAGAGGLEFAGDPELLAAFSALKSTRKRKKGAAKKKDPVEASAAPRIRDADLEPGTVAEPLRKTG
jgi:hypothetical protein